MLSFVLFCALIACLGVIAVLYMTPKPEPKVEYEFEDTYSRTLFKLKIKVDGKQIVSDLLPMHRIPAHNNVINDLNAQHYMKLKGLESVIKASSRKLSNGTQSSIWHVLGCMPTTDRTVVEKSFRKMAMVYHPDHGGTSGAFLTLTQAKEKALAKCK